MTPWLRLVPSFAILLALGSTAGQAQSMSPDDVRRQEREILKQLIEINTSDSAGNTPIAAKAMADRLLTAGFPAADVQVLGHLPRYQNLVVRYRGNGSSGKKPLLLMAHLDVVDARREDWTSNPYTLVEKDGYFYGRGTNDNKAGAAMLVSNFIRLKREGFTPSRDLIVVLSSDEETDGLTIQWLLKEHRDLIDAEYALNTDAGGGSYEKGKPATFAVQASEKVYLSFTLEVRNKGGHSSIPTRDNAIYHLSRGLARLATFDFPVRLNEVSRAFFLQSASTESAAIGRDMRTVVRTGDPAAVRRLAAADPYFNSVMRTTCVATRLFAGHADNALPQLARATVNCRMLPDDPPDSVQAAVARVVADTAIKILRVREPTASPPSPLTPEIMAPVGKLAEAIWPGVKVVPEMSTGATDGLYVRNVGIPVYGVGALFDNPNDSRAHGRDERIGVKDYHNAARFWYELVKSLATGTTS